MRLAPACRKRLSDLQPDQGIAECSQSFLEQRYRLWLKNYWETLSPPGEGDIVSQFLLFRLAFLDSYPDNYYLDDVFREVPP
ncbi:Uncharacterised protein [Klebsiella pneumoniae]|nr:Uncharacterised protein [Klebsiella pneumoniae]